MSEDEKSPTVLGSFQKAMGDAGPYVALGMQMGLTVAFYLLTGLVLDAWLGTGPWLLLLGGGIGIVVMFVMLIRAARDMTARADARRKKRED